MIPPSDSRTAAGAGRFRPIRPSLRPVRRRRTYLFPTCAVGICFIGLLGAASAWGQVVIPSVGPVYELTGRPRVDEIDSGLRGRLRQVEEALAAGRDADALPNLLRLIEGADDKLVPITRNLPGVSPRYVPLRQYGQVLLSRMPPETLQEYRRSADGTFEVWYRQAAAEHDHEKLTRLVEWGAASSWADEALWLLGEWAIQDGDSAAARSHWLRLLPAPGGDTWWGTANCSFEEPAILARLVLASILEGDVARAERELREFTSKFATVSGRFAGRETTYAAVLRELLGEVRA